LNFLKAFAKTQNSISKIAFFNTIVITFFVVLTIGYFWIDYTHKNFEKDSKDLKRLYIDNKKLKLKNEVNSAIDYINFEYSKTEHRLKDTIKSRVNNAYKIAHNIYKENLNRDEIVVKKMIKDAIRPFSWRDGDDFIWIVDYDGNYVLSPSNREFENKNILEFKDITGKYVIKEEINIVKTKKEGFFDYYFLKLNKKDNKQYKKIGFVKDFGYFNWYFGTGDFMDSVKKDILDEALERIANIRFDRNGYMFVLDSKGFGYVLSGKQITPPIDIKSITSSDETSIYKKIEKLIHKDNEGFLEYSWYKMDRKDIKYPKISFVKYLKEWDLIIGAGTYLDDIDSVLKQKELELEENLKSYAFKIVTILLFTIFIALIAFRLITNLIDKKVNNFISFFKKLEHKNVKIDVESQFFKEFKSIAKSANAVASQRDFLEFELIKQREFLQKVIDNNLSLIYVFDEQNRFILVNKTLLHYLHIDSENIIFEKVDDFIRVDSMSDSTQGDVFGEKAITFNNRNYWFQIISVPLEQNLTLNVLTDITIRKNFEEFLQLEIEKKSKKLLEQRADYKTMLDILPMVIIYKDTKNNILRVNNKFYTIFDLKKSDIENKNSKDIFFDYDGEFYLEDLEIIKTKKPKLSILREYRDKNLKFETSKFPIIKDNEVEGILVTMLNVTEKIELEEQKKKQERILIQQSKMAQIGEMMGAIAHQWKQPLSSMFLLIQDLEIEAELSEGISKELALDISSDIKNQIDFMLQTMANFRNFFKPSKERYSFSVKLAVDDILKILKAQFTKYQIEIDVIADSDSFEYLGYENEFKQVILNILNNAKDEIALKKVKKGIVSIEIYRTLNSIVINILDNAGGIDENIIDNIFEPYISTKGDKGTGIGLYMSKMIIDNLNGTIKAENREKGACFIIELPF